MINYFRNKLYGKSYNDVPFFIKEISNKNCFLLLKENNEELKYWDERFMVLIKLKASWFEALPLTKILYKERSQYGSS